MAEIGTAFLRVLPDTSGLNARLGAYFTSSNWSKLGKTAGAALGAGIAAGGAAKALYEVGEAFDDSYDKIRVQTGATGKSLNKLKDDFRGVLRSVPTDFDTAAKAVGGLNQRLEITGKPLQRLAKQFTELARITETDVETNIQSVTRAFGDWEVKTGKQSAQLDKFFRASQASGASVSDLADQVVQFGAPLRQVGFTLDEATAMFAAFEEAGVNTQTMMPGLRMALKNFLLEDIDPRKGLQKAFTDIENGTMKTSDALALFGQRAGADMVEAIKQGRFELDDLTKAMKGGDDTIRKAGRQTMDFSEHWLKFKNNVLLVLEPIATRVFEGLGNAMKEVSRFMRGKGGLAGAVEDVSGAFKSVRDSFKQFWDDSKVVRDAVDLIGDIVKRVIPAVEDIFRGFKQTVKGIVKVISGVLTGDFGRAWDGVKDIFRGALNALKGMLRAVTAPFREIASRVGDALGGAFSAAWGKIKSIFTDAVNWIIKNVLNRIPAVDLPLVGGRDTGGGSGGGRGRGSGAGGTQYRYAGGLITAPTAIVGEEAPQHPEVVIATNPRYRRRNVGLWLQAGHELGIPGFAAGGIVPRPQTTGGAFVENFRSASSWIGDMAKAPFGGLPSELRGVPGWIKDKFAEYIRSVVAAPIKSVAGAISGGMKTGATLAIAQGIAEKFGLTITSGYRSPAANAAAGGVPGSLHTHGSPSNPGAIDLVGAVGSMYRASAWAGARLKLLENMVHDAGSGLHLHLGFFKKGGWRTRYKAKTSPFNIDQLATLAAGVHMPNPELMAAIAMAESSGNPRAHGPPDGRGLWQIEWPIWGRTLGKYGDPYNPVANARMAKAVLKEQGLGAWVVYNTGAYRRYMGGNVNEKALSRDGSGGGKGGGGKSKPERPSPQERKLGRIRDRLAALVRGIARTDERIQIAQTLAGLPGSPGGAELAASEKTKQIRLQEQLLGQLSKQRKIAKAGLRMAGKVGGGAQPFREALLEVQGLTGGAGRLLDTRVALAELRSQTVFGALGQMDIGALTAFTEAIQAGAFKRGIPSFAGGGTVPGPIGSPQAAIVHGGETYFDPRNPPHVSVYIGGEKIDERVDVRIGESERAGYLDARAR